MITRLFRDFNTLWNIVFAGRLSSATVEHAERLEHFYKPQVADYDRFREKMLWGRTPLLRAIGAHMGIAERNDLIWVDVGGGTGSNVEKMNDIVPLAHFKAIYIVDLCKSMCDVAKQRIKRKGWTNVHVVNADACIFRPPSHQEVDLVTFSYSLSMIPNFHAAIDNAYTMLHSDGMIGVTDFSTSSVNSWLYRSFWLAFFDLDGIKLGAERKQYLFHKFKTYYDYSSSGRLPYTIIKAPYFLWIGHKHDKQIDNKHNIMIRRSKAPAYFPPTFLYHQSWEDPDVDHVVLDIKPTDTCLTLTSGGCNTLCLLLAGAKQVVSVDVNPAQTALLELKSVAIKYLEYDDFWKLFGEGIHEEFQEIFESKLAPYMSESSRAFWEKKHYYFRDGLYKHGSMGKVSVILQAAIKMLGLTDAIERVVHACSLQEQRQRYDELLSQLPKSLQHAFVKDVVGYLTMNKWVTWFAGGVPAAQKSLIDKDDTSMVEYFTRCIHGVVMNTHIKNDNYFYYNILTGRYTKENCPAYLKYDNFIALKQGLIDNLYISTDLFLNELQQHTYDKVILMDHADWQDRKQTQELALQLHEHVNKGGKIIFRSAALIPPYHADLVNAGFDVKCLDRIDRDGFMDRVNMYASFYMCSK